MGAASDHQQEVWLAQSIAGRIVVVWIGQSAKTSTIEYAISDDRGASWSQPAALPLSSQLLSLGDPIVTAGASGSFELVAMGGSSSMARVVAFELPPGGTTFGAPTVVDSVPYATEYFDKPQIVSTGAGFLVTYSRLRADRTGGVGVAAMSSDGRAWNRDTLASNAPVLIGLCADGNSVTATYENWFARGLWITSSLDGGATWTSPFQVETTASGDQTVPGCARRGSDVWLVYGTVVSGVGLFHSTDGGAHFAASGAVQTGAAVYGQIGLREDGTLDVAYYLSSASVPFGLAHSFVKPGTQELGTQTIIQANLQLNSSGNRFAKNGYADYIGVVPAGIAYVDNSTGTSHIAFYGESDK